MESRFGIQVKEVRKKDEVKRMRVGQEGMQGGGARDLERREPTTCRVTNGYIPRKSGT